MHLRISENHSYYVKSAQILKLREYYGYSTVSVNDASYFIGGFIISGSTYKSLIAEYRNGQWKKAGNLTRGRSYHGAIQVGRQTVVVGGQPEYGTDT